MNAQSKINLTNSDDTVRQLPQSKQKEVNNMSIDQFFSEDPNDGEYDARVASVNAKDNATHTQIYQSFPKDDEVDAGERMKMHLEIVRSHFAQYERERGHTLSRVDVLAVIRYIGYERGVE